MKKPEIEKLINKLIQEKLFSAIRKIIVQMQKERLLRSTEYIIASNKDSMLSNHYKNWYSSVSSFFLTYKSILALEPLVQRELKIREFLSQEVIRVKADYIHKGVEFSAYYPTRFNLSMTREIEDCIEELRSSKYTHVVDSYIEKKDSEKEPHEPLTTAKLKYSCFYLYGLAPKTTTKLANLLFKAGLITNPQTNGWSIDDKISEDIITVLFNMYSKEQIMEYKRSFTDNKIDRTLQECIRPTIISSGFFPKHIQQTKEFNSIVFESDDDRNNTIELYRFIYYITLSTQLKNSIYDTSKLEIKVGPKILKEQAHSIIEGGENWELLTGALLNKIDKNSDNNYRKNVVLPDIKNNSKLEALCVYSYSYQSKRPPRYGVGRFVTQILEKNAIDKNLDHDKIIQNLVESGAVVELKSMLHPQEASIFAIGWIKQHAPKFLDHEYMLELEDKILSVENNTLRIDSVLSEIDRIIEAAFGSSGFIYNDNKPSEKKIKLLKAIALKNNITIDAEVYCSNAKADIMIAKYPQAEALKVGSCPSCNSLVHQREYLNIETGEIHYYYSCDDFSCKKCKFSIWDSSIKEFFSKRGINTLSVDERATIIQKILSKKKGYLFNGFISRNKTHYDAKVFIDTYSNEEKYCLNLKPYFNNSKKVA